MSKPKKRGVNEVMKFLAQPYRLMSINKSSLEERRVTEFKGYQLLVFGIYSALVLFVVSFLLIAYSPVKNLVPQKGFYKNKKVIELMINIDSLERSLFLQNQYIDVINRIMKGDVVDSIVPVKNNHSFVLENLSLSPSKADSFLRKEVSEADFYNIPSYHSNNISSLEDFIFYKPVDGLITSVFNPEEKHFGVDVVTGKNTSVKSCLDGVVVFADWSSSKGNVIIIQHVDNIVSAYMHNAILVKETNDLVKAGEVIGMVGNSGELTSGPHLHFELWQNGTPINPEEYIDF